VRRTFDILFSRPAGRSGELRMSCYSLAGISHAAAALAAIFALSGCNNKPARIKPPAINARAAAQQALAEYDKDGDGQLAGAELDKSPALKTALPEIDKNGDGKISGEEIVERIEQWQASRIGLMNYTCKVTLNKAPLVGATVTLVPETFLGPNVLPASATTNDQGLAALAIAEDKRPGPQYKGVQVGLYRVEISKQQDGNETIPARYNTSSELGAEVAQESPSSRLLPEFALTSK
jgi:hypothetical protein